VARYKPAARATCHQLVIGGMIVDEVDASSLVVECRKLRPIIIGEPRALLGIGTSADQAEGDKAARRVAAALTHDSFLQSRVGGVEIQILERRWLVGYLVGRERGHLFLVRYVSLDPPTAVWQKHPGGKSDSSQLTIQNALAAPTVDQLRGEAVANCTTALLAVAARPESAY